MRRGLVIGFALVLLAGCQSVQEQDAIRPLRENEPRKDYDELLLRARKQIDLAQEKAYVDKVWGDVQDVATALEQTLRLLPSAPQGPDKKDKQEELKKLCTLMIGDAKKLHVAAGVVPKLEGAEREKKVREIDDILTSLNKNVRTLWKN